MKKISSVSTWLKNQRRSRLIGGGAFVALFAVVGVAVLLSSFAATPPGAPSIYLTPTSQTLAASTTFTVTVRENSGSTAVNAVQANLSYPATLLDFVSIDTTTSAFTTAAEATGAAGVVNIARGNTTPVTGDQIVATVTFRTKTTNGNAAIAFTAGTSVVDSTTFNDILGGLASTGGTTVTIGSTTVPHSASYTVEPTNPSPVVGTQFGLKVYANSDTIYKGGEVIVNLPTGLAYQAPLDTTGTAFNPASTVNGTTAQAVHLVFVTQSTTMTGKQLVATIPVVASTSGAKSVTFTGGVVSDINGVAITPITANAVTVTVNTATLPAPIVGITGKAQIAATENITNLKQAFSITNFDSTATYTATLAGQSLTVSGTGTFSIPADRHNGDHQLVVTTTKNGGSGSASYMIRLRSPNTNRVACVELGDLYAVNDGYGKVSTDFDLDYSGSVGLFDLMIVIENWGGACV